MPLHSSLDRGSTLLSRLHWYTLFSLLTRIDSRLLHRWSPQLRAPCSLVHRGRAQKTRAVPVTERTPRCTETTRYTGLWLPRDQRNLWHAMQDAHGCAVDGPWMHLACDRVVSNCWFNALVIKAINGSVQCHMPSIVRGARASSKRPCRSHQASRSHHQR